MAETLKWDLDFSKDLRPGDRFSILYEAVEVDGELYGIGDVIGLVYDNHGRIHEAYRYGDSGVYYDGEGHPLKKMFLRSPLPYSPITSLFSPSRFHPVLHGFRPHYGIDYGAPVGTPVQVTAGGVVRFTGWDGAGGNVVKVEHEGGYVSAYLHLSRFARGIRPGARVRQGDIIAFTGATGLVTGPHLDYRVKYRDQWIDPLGLATVKDQPISGAALASYHAWRDTLRRGLAGGTVPRSMLAVRRDPEAGVLPVAPPAARTGAPATARAR
jgi:murein DD-endopeptidase MepM/ murein hydrolase activator NlpD